MTTAQTTSHRSSTQKGQMQPDPQRHAEYLERRLKPSSAGSKPQQQLWQGLPLPASSQTAFVLGAGTGREKCRNSRLGQKWMRVRLWKRTMSFVKSLAWQSGQLQWLQATGTEKKKCPRNFCATIPLVFLCGNLELQTILP